METIKKILAPTDLSKLSQMGVGYALSLASAFGADVIVYYVVSYEELKRYGEEIDETFGRYAVHPTGDLLEQYKESLSRFMKTHFPDSARGSHVEQRVELGRPAANIAETAKREHVDWIVMCTHGRTGLSHLLMGSVTEKVTRVAPCPVLSIHPKRRGEEAEKAQALA